MKNNRVLKFAVIFFTIVTIINVSAVITILSTTQKQKPERSNSRENVFNINRLSNELNLSDIQAQKIKEFKLDYRKRAENIHEKLRENHSCSQLAITLNNPDSSVFFGVIDEYGELHKKMKRESIRFIQNVNMVLDSTQQSLFKKYINESVSCKRNMRKDRKERNKKIKR